MTDIVKPVDELLHWEKCGKLPVAYEEIKDIALALQANRQSLNSRRCLFLIAVDGIPMPTSRQPLA
ncbi:hypothetical protein M413DRAFT_449610 [Hebeloma cylindrosporum]|uniref:Uncharacterized protein n=1 Tax=Hebeloma cylindrosporum TaxID=76867 RepID=A0A0C3BGD9_HEBCY|nr:hypothetical protein M413DRAFT_449610 [Hebeloma cylindrosporum h7]